MDNPISTFCEKHVVIIYKFKTKQDYLSFERIEILKFLYALT